jgi:hypothetical protein
MSRVDLGAYGAMLYVWGAGRGAVEIQRQTAGEFRVRRCASRVIFGYGPLKVSRE